MLHRFLLLFAIAFTTTQISFAQPTKLNSINHRHLLVKAEVLMTIFGLVNPENNSIKGGISGEFKFNSKFSTQLSIYLNHLNEEDFEIKGILLVPEVRYYLQNHFVGLYIKYQRNQNVHEYDAIGNPIPRINSYAVGPLYGYQHEFGKFNLEGFLNVGIGKGIVPKYINNPYIENGIYLDFLLGIKAGWKFF